MRENFLIVNFFEKGYKIFPAGVDFSGKRIDFQIPRFFPIEKENEFKKFLRLVFYPQKYKVILLFSNNLAFTDYGKISVLRENCAKKIDKFELEESVSGAVFNFLEKGQKTAKLKLNFEEYEIMLVESRLVSLKIDDKLAANIFKSKGGKIDFYFIQTFASRKFIKNIISFFPRRAVFELKAEGGSLLCHLTSLFSKKEKFVLAGVDDSKTKIFLTDKEKIEMLDFFKWGNDDFYFLIGGETGLDIETAKTAMKKISQGNISKNFREKTEKIIAEALIILNKGLELASHRQKTNDVYLDFPPLYNFFDLKIRNFFSKMIEIIDPWRLKKEFGFRVNFPQEEEIDCESLASLIELDFLRNSEPLVFINNIIKEKIKWMIP